MKLIPFENFLLNNLESKSLHVFNTKRNDIWRIKYLHVQLFFDFWEHNHDIASPKLTLQGNKKHNSESNK